MKVKSPDRVIEIICDNFGRLESEVVRTAEAAGRSLAEDVAAPEDIPGFDRSTVDGYAVRAKDTFGASEGLPALVDCISEVFMGKEAPHMGDGECCLIHTGGMLPRGADAVVMLEDTEPMGGTINIYRQAAPGANIIRRGEDLAAGTTALAKEVTLRSPEIGLLASIGVKTVKVYRRPVVGVLSTGDELVETDTEVLEPGKVRDCNSPALAYLAGVFGARVINGGILPDVYDEFLQQSRALLDKVDFLVLSGGSSVGTRDFTARTLQELGKPGLLVEGISIQPGKPTLLANCGGKPVMGLPGHPVSALNIFSIFGKAVLQMLAGMKVDRLRPAVQAVLARNVPSRSGRTDYVRVRLVCGGLKNGEMDCRDMEVRYPNSRDGGITAKKADELEAGGYMDDGEPGVAGLVLAVPVFGRSGMLRTLAEADGYIVIGPEEEGLAQGSLVEVYGIE